jgi:hypothetical protein
MARLLLVDALVARKFLLIVPVLIGTGLLAESSYSQEPSPVAIPPELRIAGVWSYVETTHGVPSNGEGQHVKKGHWSVAREGLNYMTGYAFDRDNVFGRRFLVNLSQQSGGELVVEIIDAESNYTKRYGICQISKDGCRIVLAFNVPLDGASGELPKSFDPKHNPIGFTLIKLNRLSHTSSNPIASSSQGVLSAR